MTAKPETAAEVLATDIRNLIVMDTQYGWRGSTELKHEDILRLEARGWVAEGHENDEYDLTDEGRAVVERALSAQGQAVRHLTDSPEARFEQFVQAEIARSPEPLRELGDYLSDALDEDKFPRANALLLQLATSYTHSAPAQDAHPDDLAVDRFASAMKEKLAAARAKGRSGWDGPDCNADILSRMLRAHVDKGDPRDVANFCMFLHQRGEAIHPAPERVNVLDDIDIMPPWPLMPDAWTEASVTYAEDGETVTAKVWRKDDLYAFGRACVELAVSKLRPTAPVRVTVTEEMVERLAKHIAHKESQECKSLDEAMNHRSKWQRIVPEAREMLTAALEDGRHG